MGQALFSINFKTPDTFITKQIPLKIAGVDSGQITIRRNNVTGIMDLEPYIVPVSPNISNVYFFEKTVASVDINKFVTLIDVFIDTKDYRLPENTTLQQYVDAGQPNNISSPTFLDDLHRWKMHVQNKVLSRYTGTNIVSNAEFNSITSARMVPWTDANFACAIIAPPPPSPAPPPLT